MNIIVIIMSFLVGIILGLIIHNYLPSYMKKKGENLATKEDIGDITEKIEGVKNEYIKENEKLKAVLQVSATQQNIIRDKSREVLLNFFEYNLELLAKYDAELENQIYSSEKLDLVKYSTEVYSLITNIEKEFHKILLYFKRDEIIMPAAKKVLEESKETRSHFKKYFEPYLYFILLKEQQFLNEDINNMGKILLELKSSKEVKQYKKNMEPYIESYKKAFNDYLDSINKYFSNQGINKI